MFDFGWWNKEEATAEWAELLPGQEEAAADIEEEVVAALAGSLA
jgi:hypothetical protein